MTGGGTVKSLYYTPEQVAENREKAAPYRERRLALGLTQRQLGKLAGLSETCICKFEVGWRIPTWDTRQKIRLALGWPVEQHYNTEERNAIFLELQEEIAWVVRKNMRAIQAVHADPQDVFQELAVEAIRAIDRYVPNGKANVKTFVEKNIVRYANRIIIRSYLHGMTGKITYPLPDISVLSMEALTEAGMQFIG